MFVRTLVSVCTCFAFVCEPQCDFNPSLPFRGDVNECEMSTALCGEALCENVDGSFLCICPSDNEEFDPITSQCRPQGNSTHRDLWDLRVHSVYAGLSFHCLNEASHIIMTSGELASGLHVPCSRCFYWTTFLLSLTPCYWMNGESCFIPTRINALQFKSAKNKLQENYSSHPLQN